MPYLLLHLSPNRMNRSAHIMHTVFAVLISLFLLKAPTLQAQEKEVLTLEECIRIAIDTSFSVIRAQNQVDLSGAQLLSAYGNFLPNLSVNASFTPFAVSNRLQQTPIGEGQVVTLLFKTQTENAGYGLNSSLNLFNGFADYAELRRSVANKDAQTYTLDRAKQDIAFDVAQAYLQILLNKELYTISQENLKSSLERLRQLREQTRVGSRAIADLYQQEAQVGSDELAVIRADNTLQNSKLALLRRLRRDPIKEYEFVAPSLDSALLGREFLDATSLVDLAYEKRSDVLGAAASAEAADWSITQAKSGYLPRLFLSFNLNSNGFVIRDQAVEGNPVTVPQLPSLASQLLNQINYNVSLNLQWNIFDGFNRELQVEQAEINAKNTRLNLEDLKLQVVTQVKQAIGDYNASVLQVEASFKGLISAKQAYETVQKRYEVGSATFVELANAQALLVRAQSERAQAQFNFTFQKKILEYFVGTISIERF